MLNNSFNSLKCISIDIDNLFYSIDKKIKYIKYIFQLYIEKPNQDDNYKISLDILNYQREMINLEYNNNFLLYEKFIIQMYGHYFKLNKNILDFIENTKLKNFIKIENIKIKDYDDFQDDNIKYTIDDCEKIFHYIEQNLLIFKNYIHLQNEEIEKDKLTNESGIYLHNFINQKDYDSKILNEKTIFYLNDLNNFYKFHEHFLKRIHFKLKLEQKYINYVISPNYNHNKNFIKFVHNYKKNLINNPKTYYKTKKFFIILVIIFPIFYYLSNFYILDYYSLFK